MDSREVAQWEAYEANVGPLGDSYTHHLLREIHFLLQIQIQAATEGKFNAEKIPNQYAEFEEGVDDGDDH